MFHHRGLLTGLAMAMLATASLAAGVAVYMQRLPEPEEADRAALIRWLVTRDLRAEPQELQVRLLRRVEQELAAGIDLREANRQLDAEQHQRLADNVDILAELWFFSEADRYFAEPVDQRTALLNAQIEQVKRLGLVEQLSALDAAPGSPPPSKLAALAGFTRRIDRWTETVSPERRNQAAEYLAALKNQLFRASLQGLFPQS